MVTTREMRQFADDCVRWSGDADNASNRDLIIRTARGWIRTAAALERWVDDGGELALPDLRTKLN